MLSTLRQLIYYLPSVSDLRQGSEPRKAALREHKKEFRPAELLRPVAIVIRQKRGGQIYIQIQRLSVGVITMIWLRTEQKQESPNTHPI